MGTSREIQRLERLWDTHRLEIMAVSEEAYRHLSRIMGSRSRSPSEKEMVLRETLRILSTVDLGPRSTLAAMEAAWEELRGSATDDEDQHITTLIRAFSQGMIDESEVKLAIYELARKYDCRSVTESTFFRDVQGLTP